MEKRIERITKKLLLMNWNELKELGINCQQIAKLKRGEKMTFRKATLERLETVLK